jgi:hypothetical protein
MNIIAYLIFNIILKEISSHFVGAKILRYGIFNILNVSKYLLLRKII